MSKQTITLVGELNPYGADPDFALYPAPDGCSGHRLCCKILGMQRATYLEAFQRVNLCAGKWSIREARERANELLDADVARFVLCGSKVAAAFEMRFVPFEASVGRRMLVLPHPSGLCRLWHEPGAVQRARKAMADFAPHLAHLLRNQPQRAD